VWVRIIFKWENIFISMVDIIDKKEMLAEALESFVADESKKDDLMRVVSELGSDIEFKQFDLFSSILGELSTSLDELSRKELKQRILLIRSFNG